METPGEPKQEDSSKVELVRELIVGPDRREIEGQINGMRDLFTSILVENKKEYDRQVGDMKQLFVSVLEENRRLFQQQMQEMYQTLPKMIEKTVTSAQKEEFIFLAENKAAEKTSREQVDKYTRMEAIKEIILGEQTKELEGRIEMLRQQVNQNLQADRQRLGEVAAELSTQIQKSSERINAALNTLYDDLSQMLQTNDKRQAHRKLISAFVSQLAARVGE